MAGEDCARKRQSGSATAHKPPENEEVQRRPEGERSFQNASNGEVLSLGLSGVCSSWYCFCLESNVACSWLAGRVAAARGLSLNLQGQLCGSWSGFACGHCDCLKLLGYAVPFSSLLVMELQLVFFLFGRRDKQKPKLVCHNVPCEYML